MTAMQTQTQQAFHTVNHRFSTFENQFSSLRNDVQQVLALLQQKDGTANGTANGDNGGGYDGGKDNGNGELFSCVGSPLGPIRRFVGWVAGKFKEARKNCKSILNRSSRSRSSGVSRIFRLPDRYAQVMGRPPSSAFRVPPGETHHGPQDPLAGQCSECILQEGVSVQPFGCNS